MRKITDKRIPPKDCADKICEAAQKDKHGFALRFQLKALLGQYPSYREDQILNLRDENGCTALMIAAKKNYSNALKSLLRELRELKNHKINVDEKNDDGFTLLSYAVVNNNLEIVKILLDAGADIKITCKDMTALKMAVLKGHTDIAIEIINHVIMHDNLYDVLEKSQLTGHKVINEGRKIAIFFKNIIESNHEFANQAFEILRTVNPDIKDQLMQMKIEYQTEILEENIKSVYATINALKEKEDIEEEKPQKPQKTDSSTTISEEGDKNSEPERTDSSATNDGVVLTTIVRSRAPSPTPDRPSRSRIVSSNKGCCVIS